MYFNNIEKKAVSQEWLKLDTAAQLFPATSSPTNSSVFRLSVVLNQPVDETILQKATQKALEAMPSLNLRLRKGFFKRYFEYSPLPIQVEKEKDTPCQYMNDNQLTTHLMRVLYYGNRISIEVHHTLGDGLSLTNFLKTLLTHYFDTDYSNKNNTYFVQDTEDSYMKYATSDHQYKGYSNQFNHDTYHLTGKRYPFNQTSVVHGHINLVSLKQVSKKYQVTVNTVIIAVLILALQKQERHKQNKKIKIAIPVNLRTFFPSTTTRNFFGVTNVIVGHADVQSFSDLLIAIDAQLKEQLQKHSLLDRINDNDALQKNYFAKNTPLILKEKILKLGFRYFSESNKTLTVSNLGIMKLPQELENKVSHFEAIPYPTIKAPVSCGIISSKEHLVISFIKNIEGPSFINVFFSIATSLGMDIFIHGNNI